MMVTLSKRGDLLLSTQFRFLTHAQKLTVTVSFEATAEAGSWKDPNPLASSRSS
jgi:hypothetical protein